MAATVEHSSLTGMNKLQLAAGRRKTMKYARLDMGTMEAVVNKLGGMKAVDRFLRGELTIVESTRKWREEDGVIYFTVTSNGKTGEEWVKQLGERIGSYAKSILMSAEFKPTDGISTNVAVLPGELFEDDGRITMKIRAEADKRKLIKPNAEVACLICEKFTEEEIKSMGLWWIVVMHEPIKDSGGGPGLLGADRLGGGVWLSADYGLAGDRWGRGGGFAFAVSQV
jgi:hypothetical protein